MDYVILVGLGHREKLTDHINQQGDLTCTGSNAGGAIDTTMNQIEELHRRTLPRDVSFQIRGRLHDATSHATMHHGLDVHVPSSSPKSIDTLFFLALRMVDSRRTSRIARHPG